MSLMSPADLRPDFLVIGAQKAGTTSLFFDLRAQPGVYIPDEKELKVLLASRDEDAVEDYRRCFADAPDQSIRGDCSTHYAKRTTYRGVPDRARRVLGDVKLIYLVREPMERLKSHHHHQCSRDEVKGIDDAIRDSPELVDNSRYAFQLDAWLEHYPASAIKVVFLEDYRVDRASVVDQCCRHIGASFDPQKVGSRIHNQSAGKPRPDAGIQRLRHLTVYRRWFRPLLPLGLRLLVVRMLSPKASAEKAEINDATCRRLSDIFDADTRRLEVFVGRTAPWAVSPSSATEGR